MTVPNVQCYVVVQLVEFSPAAAAAVGYAASITSVVYIIIVLSVWIILVGFLPVTYKSSGTEFKASKVGTWGELYSVRHYALRRKILTLITRQ